MSAPRVPTAWSTPTSLAALQADLNARIQQLNRLAMKVASSKSLTLSDRAALTSLISNDLAGLAALQASSAGDSTPAAIHADAASMVLEFHVFSLVTPVVLGVIRADAAHAAAVDLTGLLPSIQASILASNTSADRIAQAKALLSGLPSMVASINAAVAGMSARLLALTPASIPSALPALGGLTTQIALAGRQVRVAYQQVSQIIALVAGNGAPRAHVRLVAS